MLRNLRIAFGLMTTLPIKLPEEWKAGDSGRASLWYPLVGLVIGGLVWLVWAGGRLFFPPQVAGVIALIAWVALSGGLHLDGFADCCDGLLASAPTQRRLEIMKDPHLGAFGVIGLVLVLFLKTVTLAAITPGNGLGILLAASLARWCVLPAGLLPLAKLSGLGADFAAGFRRRFILIGALFPISLALVLGRQGVFAFLAGLVVAALGLWLAKVRIGGVTGDVFGMLVELVEAALLLVFTMH